MYFFRLKKDNQNKEKFINDLKHEIDEIKQQLKEKLEENQKLIAH